MPSSVRSITGSCLGSTIMGRGFGANGRLEWREFAATIRIHLASNEDAEYTSSILVHEFGGARQKNLRKSESFVKWISQKNILDAQVSAIKKGP